MERLKFIFLSNYSTPRIALFRDTATKTFGHKESVFIRIFYNNCETITLSSAMMQFYPVSVTVRKSTGYKVMAKLSMLRNGCEDCMSWQVTVELDEFSVWK